MTTRAKDLVLLEMLHLRDVEGWTGEQIGNRFGKSRSAVLGAVGRIDRDLADDDGVGDGTMWPRWWR